MKLGEIFWEFRIFFKDNSVDSEGAALGVSYLIHRGVNVVAVSRHLGHINVEQTLNTYSHTLPNDDDAIRLSLEQINN